MTISLQVYQMKKKTNQTNKNYQYMITWVLLFLYFQKIWICHYVYIFIFPSHQTDFLVLFDNNRSKSKSYLSLLAFDQFKWYQLEKKKIHRSRQIKFVLMKSIKGACTRIIHIIYNRITSNPKYKPAHNTAELFRRRSKCSFEVIDVTSRISSDLETLKSWSYTTFQFSSKDIELLQQTSPYLQ